MRNRWGEDDFIYRGGEYDRDREPERMSGGRSSSGGYGNRFRSEEHGPRNYGGSYGAGSYGGGSYGGGMRSSSRGGDLYGGGSYGGSRDLGRDRELSGGPRDFDRDREERGFFTRMRDAWRNRDEDDEEWYRNRWNR